MTQAPVAAVDCGTNSIRLLISAGGGDLEREMRIVRLGEGVDRTGRLDPVAIERTRLALAEYRRLIDKHSVSAIRMVATSATRDAANSRDFHDMVSATLGQPAEVISGEEEASLSFAGAVDGLPAGDEYLVLDIGGGSTEFVRGSQGSLAKSVSVDIGCVRMTERHLLTDPPSRHELDAAIGDIAEGVRKGLAHVGPEAGRMIGLAGSVTTVAAIALELPRYDPERVHHSVLTASAVEEVTDRLSALDHGQRAAIPVIHPGRVDVITAGALILREVLRQSGFSQLTVSEHDILDGIAASMTTPPPRQGRA